MKSNSYLGLLSIIICFSCTSKKTEQRNIFELQLVDRLIEQSRINTNEVAILDSRPFPFQQEYNKDTLRINFNKFTILYKISANDSMIYKSLIDSVDHSIQGFLELTNNSNGLAVLALYSNNFKPTESQLEVQLFDINWNEIGYKKLFAFTKPITNSYGTGLIGQFIYEEGLLTQKVYRFSTFDLNNIAQISCKVYEPLGYFLEFDAGRLKNIYDGQVIYKGNCEKRL